MSPKARKYFVTAIDTDSGKTLVSSIICQALNADYWKPVQAGVPADSEAVKRLVSNSKTVVHPEQFKLATPASPHAAAQIDGIHIHLENFKLPQTNNTLIIEGAGGCLVPLNDEDFVIDLAARFDCEIILVANLYLGSINHTLLTASEIRKRNLRVKGIIFNGEENTESRRIILKHTGWKQLLFIEKETSITQDTIKKYIQELIKNWNE